MWLVAEMKLLSTFAKVDVVSSFFDVFYVLSYVKVIKDINDIHRWIDFTIKKFQKKL